MGSYEQNSYSLGDNLEGYIDPSDNSAKYLKQQMDEFYGQNYVAASSLWVQGAIDLNFKAGNQRFQNALYGNANLTQYQRWFFNLIRRHINMICGFQRKNRKSTITVPRNDDDDPLVDDYNKTIRWCEDRDGFQEYLSQAFEGSTDTGMTLLHLYMDYAHDPISGDLFTDYVAYNNFLIDQHFRKQDLSDCNGIWRRRWVSKEGAKLLLPGYSKEIDKYKVGMMKDGRFPLQAELVNLAQNNLFTYDEFYYRTTREATIIIDPMTNEAVEWEKNKEDPDDLMERTLYQQPWLKVSKMQVPTVKLCIALGDKNVYSGKNLLGIDEYPFVPSICYHEPDIQSYPWRVQGVVRGLRDAQFLYNMRKIIELQLLQSQVNAGWIYPTDVVVDPKCFRQASGGDAWLIPLKSGHLPNEIQRIEPSAIPQSLMELSASLSEEITKISGVNEELLGAATDDKSGILSMLRQGAGLTTLQTIFDKLDYTQRLYGKIRLQAIRKNFSKSKVRNILGHDADPRFWTSHALKYSISVEEGNYSATQRQMELQQLLDFKQLGMNIPDKSIMRAAFITNKKQLMQEIEEMSQQQMQAQMQQMQAEQQSQQAKSQETLTRAQLNIASAQEKYAQMDEQQATAEHKRTEADLNLVKMMLELETMDFDQLRSNFELAMQIRQANDPKQQVETKKPATAGV